MYFIRRLLTKPGYSRGAWERLGVFPASLPPNQKSEAIWLHAVSVGEVISLIPLLNALRQELPEVPLYLSTSTTAGREVAEREASSVVNGILFLPWDFNICLRQAFNRIRPALLVVVETEIWPKLFAMARTAGASLAIINGRISDRTWPIYRRWRALFRPVLQLPDLVAVQSETDYQRYRELGALPAALLVEANLKYDAVMSGAPADLRLPGAGQIWVAASTVGPNERGSLQAHTVDEDDLVLSAFKALAPEFPRLLLILAPRQPARFDQVVLKLQAAQLSYLRRSEMRGSHPGIPLPAVLLLDTMGELARAYSLAQVVFVGGSLAPRGGHNIVEPAAAGVPVIIGPSMQNFAAIVRDFLSSNAVLQISDAAELAPAVRNLLLDSERARELGARAKQVVERQRGVSQRLARHLLPLYYAGTYRRQRSMLLQTALSGLSWLWAMGGKYKRHRGERFAAAAEPLGVPVISVGSISVGGSGKTPFTSYLVRQMRQRGWQPGILTRGYRRRSREEILAAPGDKLPVEATGDEAQIFLREGAAATAIAADRYQAARALLHKFPQLNVLLLDDGFQHARLRRTVDIVLLDGLDPFGGDAVVPAGRLREPLTSLSRADIIVVTRCPSQPRFAAISARVHEFTPGAPIVQASTVVRQWRDCRTGAIAQLPSSSKVAAFCGLGNPRSFWDTLDTLSLNVVQKTSFGDHHRYRWSDIHGLKERAQALKVNTLVTTEKDFYNLPERATEAVGSLSFFFLEIETVVTNEEPFISLLNSFLSGQY